MVGFTASKAGEEKRVALSKPRSLIEVPSENGNVDLNGENYEKGSKVEIKGFLKTADSNRKRQGLIHVVTDEGETEKIYVPLGLMSDVVRPLFESEVLVTGIVVGRGYIYMSSIEPA